MRLRLTDLDRVWPKIEAAARKAFEGAGWIEADLRAVCRRREALCFSCEDGVVVAELARNFHRSEFELIVLFAASIGPHGAVVEYLPDIEELARELGAVRIVFWSHRRGWDRHLPPGFKLRRIEYALEVTPNGE